MNRLPLSPACENTYFSTQLAIELGSVDLAIVIQFFINVISHHKRAGRNLKDGCTWNYCTREQLTEYFPFWTEKMIRTRLVNLVKMGVLKTDRFNKNKYDHTLWYAFTDEKKWALDMIQPICPNGQIENSKRANQEVQMGKSLLPLTKHRPTHLDKVNEAAPPDRPATVPSTESASPPSLPLKKGPKSLFRGKVKFSEEQATCLDWLKTLGLDTDDATLSWWARNHSILRLDEIYREALRRKPSSIGAYMHKLLKSEAFVATGRMSVNKEFAELFKQATDWDDLCIHEKYASVRFGADTVEISFNMEPDQFIRYIHEKFESIIDR